MKADLHTHTICSDGLYTPIELITNARLKGQNIISITDHDNCNAYNNINALKECGGDIKIIAGTEMATTYNGVGIEILAYGFDIAIMKQKQREYIPTNREQQEFLFKKYMEILKSNGLQYDKETFVRPNDRVSSMFFNAISGYESNSKYLEGATELGKFIRKCVFNPNSIFYVDYSSIMPSIESIIRFSSEAGALTFIAHGFKYEFDFTSELNNIMNLSYNGKTLDGVEAIYTTFTEQQTFFLLEQARVHGYKVSGGSDCHGHDNEYTIGNKKIPDCHMTDWIKEIKGI